MINVKSKSKMIIVLAQVNIDSYNSSTGSKLWVKSLVFERFVWSKSFTTNIMIKVKTGKRFTKSLTQNAKLLE